MDTDQKELRTDLGFPRRVKDSLLFFRRRGEGGRRLGEERFMGRVEVGWPENDSKSTSLLRQPVYLLPAQADSMLAATGLANASDPCGVKWTFTGCWISASRGSAKL